MITILVYIRRGMFVGVLGKLNKYTEQNTDEELMNLKIFWNMIGKAVIYQVEMVVF